MNLNKLIDAEIASIKKSTKPVNVHLVKTSTGAYKCSLPFEIKGDYILNSKNLNDVPVSVEYNNNNVEVEIDSEEEEINAFLSKDESTLLKAVKKSLKCDSFTDEPAFIVGPPGTGKTKVITKIIEEGIKNNKKILITSPTNMAVENVFERIDTDKLGLSYDQIVLTIKTEEKGLKSFSPENIKTKKLQPLLDEVEVLEMAKKELLQTKMEVQPKIEMKKTSKESLATMLSNKKRILNQKESEKKEVSNSISDLKHRIDTLSGNTLIKSIANIFMSKKLEEFEQQMLLEQKKLDTIEDEIKSINEEIESLENSKTIADEEYDSSYEELSEAENSIKKISDRIKTLKKDIEMLRADNIYNDVKIVGATLFNAALNQKIQNAEFDMIIVDEASMALVPLLVTVSQSLKDKKEINICKYKYDDSFYEAQNKAIEMALNKKIVFVGDPKQLPPIARTFEMQQSIFDIYEVENIFNGEDVKNAVLLNKNFRNHPHITKASSELFYGGMLKSGKKDDGSASLFIKRSSSKMVASQGSFINYGNMKIAVAQVEMALKRGRRSVGIITPYRKQALLIEENILQLKKEYPDADIQAGTVHTFQGKEKEIIIYDLTFSPGDDSNYIPAIYNGDIDSNTGKLLNVAMTRAESFFIVIGDIEGILNIKTKNLIVKDWLLEILKLKKQ